MKVVFEKIKIHGFLSFGDSELNLNSQGYVLVSGVNHNPKDSALSNGSGKSSIWSAICWALTGETIQGLSKNICNINISDGCFVELDFSIDNDKYKIIRYRNYAKVGTDLKIYINGKDMSGKGITESQKLLKQYLPDITSELIGSVIILGQGLPHKFSNNTPAGRKEVLEKLSKSDFMIQDIKDRLAKRRDTLNIQLRKQEDELLENTTKSNIYNQQLEETKKALDLLNIPVNFDSEISTKEIEINQLNIDCETIQNKVNNLNQEYNNINSLLLQLSRERDSKIDEVRKNLDNKKNELYKQKTQIDIEIGNLDSEIRRLKNIKDICPTCGQKLPNVIKPDTSEKEARLNELRSLSAEMQSKLDLFQKDYNDDLFKINSEFNLSKASYDKNLSEIRLDLATSNNSLTVKLNAKVSLTNDINKLKVDRDNYLKNKHTL